jgi:hypothetical protein
VIPIPIMRWILVGLAFALSGYFLVANTYPILASVCPVISTRCIVRRLILLGTGGTKTNPLDHNNNFPLTRRFGTHFQSHVLQLLCRPNWGT